MGEEKKAEWKVSVPGTYLEEEEVKELISAIPYVSKHPDRDELVLRTLWESGGRVSEVVQLQQSQILEKDSALFLLNLKREDVKYKKPYVSKNLVKSLLSFCEANEIVGDSYVFKPNRPGQQSHLGRGYVWWVVKKAARYAGVNKVNLTRGKKVPAWTHLFRHGCAMHILDKTGKTEKAQRQLGHSNIITTQVYATLKLVEQDKEISDIW